MGLVAGWTSIFLVIISLAFSVVPGVISIFGLVVSIFALGISLFSIKNHRQTFFRITATVAIAGMLLVSDSLRIWNPIDMPPTFRFGLYGIALLIFSGLILTARRLGRPGRHAG